MLIGTPAKKWVTKSVPELLASPQADIASVLLSDDVPDYLHSIQSVENARVNRQLADSSDREEDGSSDGIPTAVLVVLQYIMRNADTLFALLHGEAQIENGIVARQHQPRGPLQTVCTTPGDAKTWAGVVQIQHPSKGNDDNGSRMAADTIEVSHGGSRVNDASIAAVAAVGNADEEEERRCLANLTELLSFCITHSQDRSEINAVVAACIQALSREKTLESQRSFAVQRLLLEAFDSDFEATTQAIADALTHSTIKGVVENLAGNSIVAETLIALFGSALSAVWMVKPTTKTALFTSQWIRLDFPTTLCAYLPVAIRDTGMYHYFYFYKELLKRGYSHSAGPIVDVLLSEPLVSEYVECILSCCEQDVGRSALLTPDGAAATPVSLVADGMEVLVSIIGLVRKSLVLPETSFMYHADTRYITPVAVLQQQAPRLTALLSPTPKQEPELDTSGPSSDCSSRLLAAVAPGAMYGLGPLRLAVCELFVEFSLFQLASTDNTLITSGFFPAFIGCCERFPQHDALARALHRCILSIFQRATLVGESLNAAAERDCLWRYLVKAGTVVLQCGAVESVLGALTHLAQIPNTSLSSLCIDVLSNLSSLPLFQSAAGGPFEEVLEAFKASEVIQERVRHMDAPITGENFEEGTSTGLPEPVHRETINLAGDCFHGPKVGILSSGSHLSGLSSKFAKGRSIVVSRSVDDDRPRRPSQDVVIDMKALKEEVYTLQQGGSPAVQSYPSFSNVKFSFFSSSLEDAVEDDQDEAAAPSAEQH
ncbi:hypothetical protein, conserved [Leishmania tarentolae]|uniref:Uncharacterized protein n=1 Tax=Leishmania tarentolae TaxID=5689 RepID=A0A640KPD8_LEITA|nr:hypothetical protein, conserved [Leishmania tarentolae]